MAQGVTASQGMKGIGPKGHDATGLDAPELRSPRFNDPRATSTLTLEVAGCNHAQMYSGGSRLIVQAWIGTRGPSAGDQGPSEETFVRLDTIKASFATLRQGPDRADNTLEPH